DHAQGHREGGDELELPSHARNRVGEAEGEDRRGQGRRAHHDGAVEGVSRDLAVYERAGVIAPLRREAEAEYLRPEEVAGFLERIVEHPQEREYLEQGEDREERIEDGLSERGESSIFHGAGLLALFRRRPEEALDQYRESHGGDHEEDRQGVSVAVLPGHEGFLVEVDGYELRQLARASLGGKEYHLHLLETGNHVYDDDRRDDGEEVGDDYPCIGLEPAGAVDPRGLLDLLRHGHEPRIVEQQGPSEALPDDDPDHRAEGRMGIRQPGGGETLEPDEGEDLVEDAVGRIEYVDPELRDDHEGEDRRYEIDRAHAAREALAD